MRTNLQVPFAEKDEAKKLGAKWDAARKVWYIEDKVDLAPFEKWMPTITEGSGFGVNQSKRTSVKKQQESQSVGLTIVGANYVERPRICECLPWDVCDKCRSTALNN